MDLFAVDEWYKKGLKLYNSQNYSEAKDIFLLTSVHDHAESQYYLGVLYYKGYGVGLNYNISLIWYLQAANLECLPAQNNVGIMYYYGYGVQKDYNVAAKWFMKAAERGYSPAQNSLGHLYQNGLGTLVNHEEAFKWYKMASDKGEISGQINTGFMYYHALGITENHHEAFRLYRLAADYNDTAKKRIGYCYQHGHGVELDLDKAFEWYGLAAKEENKEGQTNLGIMYLDGLGIETDPDVEQEFEIFLKKAQVHTESQILAADGEAETELQRESRESKEQISILLARLAVKDSEIENLTKTVNKYEDAEGIKAVLAQDNEDKNSKKQRSKEPIMFFQV